MKRGRRLEWPERTKDIVERLEGKIRAGLEGMTAAERAAFWAALPPAFRGHTEGSVLECALCGAWFRANGILCAYCLAQLDYRYQARVEFPPA